MQYWKNHLVQLEDLYWRVGVEHHHENSTLGVYLQLAKSKENITFCSAKYTLKIVHTADSTKSVEKRDIGTFIPGGVGCGWHDVFDWNILVDAQNGFQVKDQFTIEATVEVISETFTETVDLEDVPNDHVLRGQFHNIRYLPWCLLFRHHMDKSTLSVYLSLFPGFDKTVKTCSGKFKLKLIHPTNNEHSIVKEAKHTFVPYFGCFGSWGMIDWNDLKSRFVDVNKFVVQATITVIDIDRF
ncbi:hypothetical protein SNE40_008025 [Patella caerulea]|uniref:MATH domain-containing protein n=1 Tax=Patella caerulea TaxID=87958 RepID=A0AAN8JYV7_PATCE